MMDGLILTVRRTKGKGFKPWIAYLDGGPADEVANGNTADYAMRMWLFRYGSKYGVQPEPEEMTVLLPLQKHTRA